MSQSNALIDIGRKLKLNVISHGIYFIKNLFHYRGIGWGKLISINDILSSNFPNVNILSYENVRLQYSPPLFSSDININSELSEGREYPQYVVQIKNAVAYGDSNTINVTPGKVLYDMPVFDKRRRFKYSTPYSKIITIKGDTVFYWKGKTMTVKEGIWMGGNYSWNYYHLLYEFIIKFRRLDSLNIPTTVPVLVDQVCLDVPQFKELLGIANNKGYPLIGIDRQYRVKVGELTYINCPNFIPPDNAGDDSQSSDVQLNINALLDLRTYLLSYSSKKEFPKRIFISRKNASGRRKFNEGEIIQMLSEFGFEVVFPETLSVADQISLFSQAELIIGGSGAAFSNLLFCNNQTKAIILYRFHIPFSGFSTPAFVAGAYLFSITEEDTNKNMNRGGIHDTYEIDLSYLKKRLVELGI